MSTKNNEQFLYPSLQTAVIKNSFNESNPVSLAVYAETFQCSESHVRLTTISFEVGR